ncbi:hypothetical protein BDF19DRAFT_417287 [Syncephalis fuscata]|nr:hypothetical protein BDF19DRAFT_417287 [Syncephalis fuscata]
MTTAITEVSAKSSMLSMSTAVTSANASQFSLPRTTRSSMAHTFIGMHERSQPLSEPTPTRQRSGKKSRVGATLRSAAGLFKKFCAPIISISTSKSSKNKSTSPQLKRNVRNSQHFVYKPNHRHQRRSSVFINDTTASAPVMLPSNDDTTDTAAEVSCFCALHGAVSTAFEHHPCCPLINDSPLASLAANWPVHTSALELPEAIHLSTRRSISATGLAERLRSWKPRGHRSHVRSQSQPFSQSRWRNAQFLTACYNDPTGPKVWTDDVATVEPTPRRGGSLDLPRTAELFYTLPPKAQRQLFSPEERLVLTGRPDNAPLRRRTSQHCLAELYQLSNQHSSNTALHYSCSDSSALELELNDDAESTRSFSADSYFCSSSIAISRHSSEEIYSISNSTDEDAFYYTGHYSREDAVPVNIAPLHQRNISTSASFNPSNTRSVALSSSQEQTSSLSDRHYHYNDSRVRRMLRRFRSRQRFDEMLWFGFAGEEEGEGRTLTVRVTLTPDMLQAE